MHTELLNIEDPFFLTGEQTMARNQVIAKLTFSSLAVPLLAVAFLQPNVVFAQDDALGGARASRVSMCSRIAAVTRVWAVT